MKIVIPTIGSRGDVQPFIALAQGLLRSGHDVVLASHPVMQSLVQAHQVAFVPIGPDIDLARVSAEIRQGSKNAAAGILKVMRFSFNVLRQSHEDILKLCSGADLVVVSAQSAAGLNEADLLGIPFASVTFMPWAIPWDDPQRPLYRRAAYGLIDLLVSRLTTGPLNRIRKAQGLPPVGREGFTSLRLNLIPVSPAVTPPNPRWEPHHNMVGYWFADDPAGWEPPVGLVNFLKPDQFTVAISLGAMSLGDYREKETLELFATALQETGTRAIIQGWQAAAQKIDLPPNILITGSIPHSWLLARCNAVVHHGGFGTTAAGLRAGIPALVIPHIADQFYWGKQVHDIGAGPPAISRRKLTLAGLVSALEDLKSNTAYYEAASSHGNTIGSEKGVENAIRQISETFFS